MELQHSPLPLQPKRSRLALPLAGERVAAGFPSPAEDYVDVGIDLNEQLIRHPTSTFFLHVSGHSMTDAGIHDGDLLVVDRSLDPRPGQVVVAVLDGAFTLKRRCAIAAGCAWKPPIRTIPPWSFTTAARCRSGASPST